MTGTLRAILGTWRGRGGVAVVALTAALAWFNPLTDHLGFSAALVAALACSEVAVIVGAGIPAALRRRELAVTGGDVAAAAGAYGAALVALFALLAALRSAFGNLCTPGRGAAWFALAALPGAVLAGLVGVLLGALVRRAWLATTLAVFVPPASIAWSLVRFYQTPAIFAYDPFFGFFPGTLYDETVPLTSAVVTYRLGTLGAIVAAAGAIAWLFRGDGARLARPALAGRAPAALTTLAGLAVALAVYLSGSTLGHRHDARDVARVLGGRIDGRRCTVVYAREIGGRAARLAREDCELRLAQLEAFFGLGDTGRVTVYLFRDATQKQQLMGAADVYIAKPWRREVYLQHAPFPHPVLKHELAHVVTGAMASGPFYVASRFRLVPLPGLVEGAAVAGAWEGESDASPHEWTAAMLGAGLTPPLAVLTGLGFFAHASGTAYTAAGSFSRWLVERYGAARYRDVYRDGDFARAYGRSVAQLEREWHAFLRTVPVSPRVATRARTRFRRAPLIARVCPHETAELMDGALVRLAAGDVARARDELTRVVRNDPTEVHARVALAEAWTRLGRPDRAATLASEAARDLGPAAAARVRARVGDVVWRWRGPDAARELYAAVDPELFDDDEARGVEVKRWALGLGPVPADPAYTVAIQDLLVGRAELEHDSVAAASRLALEFRAGPRGAAPDALAGYLIARMLQTRERHADAVALLASIDPARLPTDRLRVEARRVEAVSRFHLGELDRARALFASLADDPSRPTGARDEARDWVDRIARARR